MLNIDGAGTIGLPSTQIVLVHPSVLATAGGAPSYRENTLNAVAQAVSTLQGLAHYEGYALTLHTIPYADLYEALPTTLIKPVQPVSSLVKAGIFGTGVLPPFVPLTLGAPGIFPTPIVPATAPAPSTVTIGGTSVTYQVGSGLPAYSDTNLKNPAPAAGTQLSATTVLTAADGPLKLPPLASLFPQQELPANLTTAAVLYTGVVVGLTGNTMDLVRGQMDDGLDVSVTFNQKDQNEQYRFRAAQRIALRLKDPTAVILLLFLDC